MGLDTIANTIVSFKADTRDLEQGLKRLQGVEKEHQQSLLDHAKSRNDSYDGWLKNIANVNQALELGGKVVSFLADAWKEYADDVRLATAAGSANIDKLRSASLGLRTEQDLMTFAAKAQNGVIKANQEQMEVAQRAMIALTRAGFDQAEVTDKVTSAMVSLKTRGLESLGVTVKEGKTDLETYTNLMAALGDKASGVTDSSVTAGEGIQQMSVSMADSFDNMKSALGELVQAMAPLLKALATAVELIAKIAVESTKDINWIDVANKQLGTTAIERDKESAAAIMQMAIDSKIERSLAEVYGAFQGAAAAKYASGLPAKPEAVIEMDEMQIKPRGKGKPRDSRFGDYASVTGQDTAGAPIGFGGTLYGGAVADTTQYDEYGRAMSLDTGAPLAANYKALTDDWNKRLGEQRAEKTSFLESSFGKLEDFNAYATAFGALTGSVTAAMDAWITGSMSAGQAVKKFLADALKGLASQMAVEALKHGAYAIGSAAFGDFRGAGQHAAAAAAFGGAAAAAAVAAKSLGGGAAPTASGGGAGASGGGSSASGGTGTQGGVSGSGGKAESSRPVYILVGDSFSMDSPRMRQQRAQEAMDKALRERDE